MSNAMGWDRVARPVRAAILGAAFAVGVGAAAGIAAPVMHVHDSGGNLGTVDVTTGNVNLIGNIDLDLINGYMAEVDVDLPPIEIDPATLQARLLTDPTGPAAGIGP